MTKAIRFDTFKTNCVGHQSPGLRRDPHHGDIEPVRRAAVSARTAGVERRAKPA